MFIVTEHDMPASVPDSTGISKALIEQWMGYTPGVFNGSTSLDGQVIAPWSNGKVVIAASPYFFGFFYWSTLEGTSMNTYQIPNFGGYDKYYTFEGNNFKGISLGYTGASPFVYNEDCMTYSGSIFCFGSRFSAPAVVTPNSTRPLTSGSSDMSLIPMAIDNTLDFIPNVYHTNVRTWGTALVGGRVCALSYNTAWVLD